MKPKVNIFDGRKKNAIFQRVDFKTSNSQADLLYFGYLADVPFLKPAFKEIVNNSYLFEAATYVEQHGFNSNWFAQMTNIRKSSF